MNRNSKLGTINNHNASEDL